MIVWGGLIVSLLVALVGSFKDLKQPSTSRCWSKKSFATFVQKNRLPLLSISLAIVAFALAALGIQQTKLAGKNELDRIRRENEKLQSLVLQGKTVKPAVSLVVDTPVADLFQDSLVEEWQWKQSGILSSFPRPIGFIPSRFRLALFPLAKPEPLLKYLGTISIRTARPEQRIELEVRDDGSVIDGPFTLVLKDATVGILDHSTGQLNVAVANELDSLGVFESIILGYEKKIVPLRISVFRGPSNQKPTSVEIDAFRKRRGRISFYLDNLKQLSATAMVSGRDIELVGSNSVYNWDYAEAPQLDVAMPGGVR